MKREKYSEIISSKNATLIVLAYEVFGAMSEQVTHLVHRLGKKMIDQAPEDAVWNSSSFASYWIKALSVALHCGTVAAVKLIAGKIIAQQRPYEKDNRYELEAQPVQYDAAMMQMAANVPQVLGANPPVDHGVLVDDKYGDLTTFV